MQITKLGRSDTYTNEYCTELKMNDSWLYGFNPIFCILMFVFIV